MSFFGAFNDPFFGDMHRMMRQQMREMESYMDVMVDPFAMMGGRVPMAGVGPRQQMIDDSFRAGRQQQQQQQRFAARDPMAMMMQPFGFGFGGGMFGGVQNMMQQMEQLQSHAANDPQGHVYSQSTVIAMTPGADGRTQVYQATDSVRKAGDVKETRRTVRDTERGVEKMTIGHHIGERGHVVEKRRDRREGGRIVENQQFINLNEDQAHQFDHEWSHATRRAVGHQLEDGGGPVAPRLPIEASRSDRRRTASPYDGRRARVTTKERHNSPHQPSTSSTGKRRVVRVEEPPEEPSTSAQQPTTSGKKGGPIIEEIID